MQVEVRQGVQNKQLILNEFAQIKGITREKIWAVENDVNDLSLFESANFTLCPRDASPEIKLIANLTLPINGGEGILNFLANALEKNLR